MRAVHVKTQSSRTNVVVFIMLSFGCLNISSDSKELVLYNLRPSCQLCKMSIWVLKPRLRRSAFKSNVHLQFFIDKVQTRTLGLNATIWPNKHEARHDGPSSASVWRSSARSGLHCRKRQRIGRGRCRGSKPYFGPVKTEGQVNLPREFSMFPRYSDVMNCWMSVVLPDPPLPNTRTL